MPRCCDCGFLALRNSDSWELAGADDYYRENGELHPTARPKFHDYPICFARQFKLKEEYLAEKDKNQAKDKPGARLSVLHGERECVAYVDWRQGFTPKEHMEMRVEQAVREANEREAERQRTWQAEQSRLADERYAKESEKADERHNQNLKAVIEAGKSNWISQVAVGILGAIIALVAVWIAAALNKPPQIINVLPSPPTAPAAATPPDIEH